MNETFSELWAIDCTCIEHPWLSLGCQILNWVVPILAYILVLYFHNITGFCICQGYLQTGFCDMLGPDASQYLERQGLLENFKDVRGWKRASVHIMLLHTYAAWCALKLTGSWLLQVLRLRVENDSLAFQTAKSYVTPSQVLGLSRRTDAFSD